MRTMDTTKHSPQNMNVFENANGEQRVVNASASEIEMPDKPGGSMMKWKRVNVNKRHDRIVVAKDMPKGPVTLPPSTPGPVTQDKPSAPAVVSGTEVKPGQFTLS